MVKRSARKRVVEDTQQPIIFSHENGLWNGSLLIEPTALLEEGLSAIEFSFPKSKLEKAEEIQNPGLKDEMMHLNLLHCETAQENGDRCIHCERMAVLPGMDVCTLCSAKFFVNPKLESAYRYCKRCRNFHFYQYFIKDDCTTISDRCICNTSSIKPSFKQMVTCVPPTHHTRMKQTVMSFLQSHSLLFVQEDHCHHCGCLWDTSANGPFCSRCRAGYYFILPDSLSSERVNYENENENENENEEEEEEEERMNKRGKRRKISSSSSSSSSRHVQRCYRWCKGCNDYHWSGEFINSLTHRPLSSCRTFLTLSHTLMDCSNQPLPQDPSTVIDLFSQAYEHSRTDLTFEILRRVKTAFGHSLRGYCVRCLKKNIDRVDAKNRTNFGKRVQDVNTANEPLVCQHCKDRIFSLSTTIMASTSFSPLLTTTTTDPTKSTNHSEQKANNDMKMIEQPIKYCTHCNLFHTAYQFFDMKTKTYLNYCNQEIIEYCWNQNKLPYMPKVIDTPIALTDKDQRPLSQKAMNRCRSPMCFQFTTPSHPCICVHCRRALTDLRREASTTPDFWICSFCQEHWFVREDGRRYHYCSECKAFHLAFYFFDPTENRFLDVCLPSSLNAPRQRTKDRLCVQKISIAGENTQYLPSLEATQLVCSKLTLENPHEKLYTGLFIACIMEELWKSGK